MIFIFFSNLPSRYVSEFVKALLTNIIQQMPVPASQNLNSYLSTSDSSSQRSFMSSVASGLWSVMTLGLASSSYTTDDTHSPNDPIVTYLPSLPNDNSSNSGNINDAQIDCSTRLLAWQSCHILLVLSNHCTNESLFNPFRLALFHFTDTQGFGNISEIF